MSRTMEQRKAFMLEMWGTPHHTYSEEPEIVIESSTTADYQPEILDIKPSTSEIKCMQEAWGWNTTAVNPTNESTAPDAADNQSAYEEPPQVELDQMISSWGWNSCGQQTLCTEANIDSIDDRAQTSVMDNIRELTNAEVDDMKAAWGWNASPDSSRSERHPNEHSNVSQAAVIGNSPSTDADMEHIKSAWAWNSYMMSTSTKAPRLVSVDIMHDRKVTLAEERFVKSNWAWNAYVLQDMNEEEGSENSDNEIKQWQQKLVESIEMDGNSHEKENRFLAPPLTPEASPESVLAYELDVLPPPLRV